MFDKPTTEKFPAAKNQIPAGTAADGYPMSIFRRYSYIKTEPSFFAG